MRNTPEPDRGAIVAFDHNEDGRLTGEWVGEGWTPIPDTSAYRSTLDSNYTRVRLIDRPPLSNSDYLKGFSASITDAPQ